MYRNAIVVFLLGAAAAGATQLPLFFEPNQGQAPAGVEFVSRANGVASYLMGREALLQVGASSIRMELIGAARAHGEGVGRLPGLSSYFAANPRDWHTRIPQFDRVRYRGVYPGVDLIYYGNHGQLEYDLVLAPGADPSQIRLTYRGIKDLKIDQHGNLVLTTADGEIRQQRPAVYQEVNGKRTEIAAAYKLAGNGEVSLEMGAYDARRTLTIDPVLEYGTFIGAGIPLVDGLKVDSSGNVYMAGSVPATASATANGNLGTGNWLVIKFSPAQNKILYYATLVPDGQTTVKAIDIDPGGNAYIGGQTYSTQFPLVSAYQSSAITNGDKCFVAKLAPDGQSLVYSTYLNGTKIDYLNAIAVDANGNAFVAGQTTSPDFPVLNALQPKGNFDMGNAFLAKFSPTGTLLFSTFFGGSFVESALAVALDSKGAPVIAGLARSSDFPYKNAVQTTIDTEAGFAAKFTADGQSVVFATALGGPWSSAATLGFDQLDNVWVAGPIMKPGTLLPLVNPLQTMPSVNFIGKVAANGGQLLYQSYFGGSNANEGFAGHQGMVVDSAGHVYVGGSTLSPDFPLVNSLAQYQSKPESPSLPSNGTWGFVSELSADGQRLVYSTLLGGTRYGDAVSALALDSSGALWVAGTAGSDDFPLKNAYQSTFASGSTAAAFLVKLTGGSEASGPSVTSSPGVLNFSYTTGGASPAQQALSIGTSTGAAATFSATVSTSSGGSWVSVGSAGGTTPSQLTVSANPSGLAVGSYSGSIRVTAGNFSPIDIPVWLTVSAPASILQSSAQNLAFDTSGLPNVVYVHATDGSAVTVNVTTSTSSGGNWLLVTPTSFVTTGMVTVRADATGLAVGTYSGTIHFTPPSGPGIDVQALLQVNQAQPGVRLTANPASLSAQATAGGSSPAAQVVAITPSAGAPSFTATVTAGANWLAVSPSSGSLPLSLSFSMNTSGLSSGAYSGNVRVTSSNGGSVDVPVTLNVAASPAAVLTALSPTSLTANALQPVVTLRGSGFVPGALVHVNIAGVVADQPLIATYIDSNAIDVTLPVTLLVAGRTLNLTVVNPGAAASNSLALTITSATPAMAISAVRSAASWLTGAVAPGELLTLSGTALGPAQGVNAAPDSTGVYPTSLSGVRVLFDGQAAPLLYVSATQINTVVPFRVAGAQNTAVQVEYQNVLSDAVTVSVAATAPGLFTMDSSGSGPGAFLNSDMTPNLSTNAAAPGSVVALYATGGGKMAQSLTDGKLVSQLVSPVASVAVTIDGQPADLQYAGAAPTLVAGLLQINVVVPQNVRTGTSVPVTLRIGDVSAQSGVTLSVSKN